METLDVIDTSEFDSLNEQFASLEALYEKVMTSNKLERNIAFESEVLLGSNAVLNTFYSPTDELKKKQAALESISAGMLALVVAAIAALVAVVGKIYKHFFGKKKEGKNASEEILLNHEDLQKIFEISKDMIYSPATKPKYDPAHDLTRETKTYDHEAFVNKDGDGYEWSDYVEFWTGFNVNEFVESLSDNLVMVLDPKYTHMVSSCIELISDGKVLVDIETQYQFLIRFELEKYLGKHSFSSQGASDLAKDILGDSYETDAAVRAYMREAFNARLGEDALSGVKFKVLSEKADYSLFRNSSKLEDMFTTPEVAIKTVCDDYAKRLPTRSHLFKELDRVKKVFGEMESGLSAVQKKLEGFSADERPAAKKLIAQYRDDVMEFSTNVRNFSKVLGMTHAYTRDNVILIKKTMQFIIKCVDQADPKLHGEHNRKAREMAKETLNALKEE